MMRPLLVLGGSGLVLLFYSLWSLLKFQWVIKCLPFSQTSVLLWIYKVRRVLMELEQYDSCCLSYMQMQPSWSSWYQKQTGVEGGGGEEGVSSMRSLPRVDQGTLYNGCMTSLRAVSCQGLSLKLYSMHDIVVCSILPMCCQQYCVSSSDQAETGYSYYAYTYSCSCVCLSSSESKVQ